MVLTEAMAAGVPVVAVDAPGIREIVRDRVNGRLLAEEDADAFVAALGWTAAYAPALRAGTTETAERFSLACTADRALGLYADLIAAEPRAHAAEDSAWVAARRRLGEEWRIVRNIAAAAGDAWLAGAKEAGPR
jgi:glycosyltransferase involved in cell wall biosynthesis